MGTTGTQPISTIPLESITPGSGATVLLDGAHAGKPSWLDGFRRITTSGEFIPEIDGLRFIAIAVVVLRHLALFIYFWLGALGLMKDETLFMYGRHGVELFFAISGFILATPFALESIQGTRKVKLSRYFLRRVTRLEPPYLLSLLILFALKRYFDPAHARWLDLLLPSLYINGIAVGTVPQLSVVAWSLEVEIQFYVLMPLLAYVYWIGNRWVRRGCMVGFGALMVYLQPLPVPGFLSGEPYAGNILNYVQYFLAGLLLADVYATEWKGAPPEVRARGVLWGDFVWLFGWPLLLFVFVRAAWSGGDSPDAPPDLSMRIARASTAPLIFLLYFSLFHSVWARKFMRLKIITTIGGMCYSIYLVHNIVAKGGVQMLTRWLPHNFSLALLIASVVLIPLILIESGIYFKLIERPCMRPDWPKRLMAWLRRFTRPQPQPSQTSEP